MSKLPGKLREKQEHQRQITINLVLRAIAELEAEGYSIKIKDLMDRAGLSRSVFAKPHIRELLVSKGIVKAETSCDDTVASKDKSSSSSLRNKLRQKDIRISALTSENEALRDECALLRGQLFLLMQRMEMQNFDNPVDLCIKCDKLCSWPLYATANNIAMLKS